MAYELKPGQGSLFRNDKQGNDKRPDYTGKVNLGGAIWHLSGWIQESKSGEKYLSIKANVPGDTKPAPQESKASNPDDAIPW